MERARVFRWVKRGVVGAGAGAAAVAGAGCDVPSGAAVNTPTPKVIQCQIDNDGLLAQAQSPSQDVSESSRWMARIMGTGGIQTMQPDRRGGSYVVVDAPSAPTADPTPTAHPPCVGEGTPVVAENILSQLSPDAQLLLSHPAQGTKAYNDRVDLINRLIIDLNNTVVPENARWDGDFALMNPALGLTKNVVIPVTGEGFAVTGYDATTTLADGTTDRFILIPTSSVDPRNPGKSNWVIFVAGPDGSPISKMNQQSTSTGINADVLLKQQVGKLVTLRFVTKPDVQTQRGKQVSSDVVAANKAFEQWVVTGRGEVPGCIVTDLSKTTLDGTTPVQYGMVEGYQ